MKAWSILATILLTLVLAGCANQGSQEVPGIVVSGYIVAKDETRVLLIDNRPKQTPNGWSYYDAYWLKGPIKKLEVGQEVSARLNGPVAESYPAQAVAIRFDIKQSEPVQGARLSKAEAVKLAIESARAAPDFLFPVIDEVSFDATSAKWSIRILYAGTLEPERTAVLVEVDDKEKRAERRPG